MKLSRISFFILMFLMTMFAQAQKKETSKENNLIQFSGMVLDQDSLTPIPYVSIVIRGTDRGTISMINGFFSLIIKPGDELDFSSMTHKQRSFKIPDTLNQKYYYAIQVLTKDTIDLPIVDIYNWPSKDDFKRAFLALNLNDTDGERAERNLSREELTYLERNQTASASENYKYVMQNYYTKIYTSGQSPENNLMNPVKWAEFISAWRDGKFSSSSSKKKK